MPTWTSSYDPSSFSVWLHNVVATSDMETALQRATERNVQYVFGTKDGYFGNDPWGSVGRYATYQARRMRTS
jgi:hypothetical protein